MVKQWQGRGCNKQDREGYNLVWEVTSGEITFVGSREGGLYVCLV